MYGRIHSDICNVPLYLLSGVKIQIKFTKSKQAFFLISNKADSEVKLLFKEARLYVKRIRPNAKILTSHNEALLKGYPARYNFTRVELKTFTCASGQRSLSLDNVVLGVLSKRLIFTMVKTLTFWVAWIRTPTTSDIMTWKTLQCMLTVDRSLQKA